MHFAPYLNAGHVKPSSRYPERLGHITPKRTTRQSVDAYVSRDYIAQAGALRPARAVDPTPGAGAGDAAKAQGRRHGDEAPRRRMPTVLEEGLDLRYEGLARHLQP